MKNLLILAMLPLAACLNTSTPAGPTQTDTVSIEGAGVESVDAELDISAGDLRLDSGAAKLVEGSFAYNVPSWKPEVRYDHPGGHGHLVIAQPRSSGSGTNTKNRWDLRLNDATPLNLQVRFGAGEGTLNLGKLDLRGLAVKMGVGRLEVDLRGTPKKSYNVSIHGGVGEAVIYLPSGVGVVATAHGGLGSIEVTGLRQQEDRYINEQYMKSPITIRVDVQGGIGHIRLIG